VRQPDRLIYLTVPTGNPERPEGDTFSDPVFLRLRDAARGHVDLFAMSTQVLRPAKFDGPAGEKEQLRTQFVSGDAFDRLGVVPAAGRLIARQDDLQPGAHPVAVVSHAFWMRRFGGDPAIVGRWFTLADSRFALEDRPFQIVGVAERGFTGIEPGRPSDLWLPYAMYNPRAFGNFYFGWFRILGRLNDDVRVESAQAVVQAAFTNLRRERARLDGAGPARSPAEAARFIVTPIYLRSAANGPSPLRGQFERPLWILAAIAALVVLIAGSNVANLFLARTAVREHEMALRLSIGAGRGRLIQQMLVESALRGAQPLPVVAAGLIVFASAKLVKWAAIVALGRSWTFRVIVVPGDSLVASGPYRYLRHPNYVGVVGEFVGAALMTGAIVTGPVALLGFGFLLWRRIAVEERALLGARR